MIVEILKDIFEEDSNLRELDKLWHVIEGRHKLFLRRDEDINALMESEWFETQRGTVQEYIYESIQLSMQTTPTTSNVIISNQTDDKLFTIKEADRYLKQIFFILVENSNNDGNFLDAIFKIFEKEGGKLIKEHYSEGWLEYDFGGGSSIKDVIQTKLNSYKNSIFIKNKSKYLRFFVLIDSDRIYQTMPLDNGKINLITFLKDNNIPFHILEKREMENYLPNKVINTIPDYRSFIDAYLKLHPIQKDYFDLEKGFPDKSFEKLYKEKYKGEFQKFYSNLDEKDIQTFRKNDLKEFPKGKKEFKSEFPKLFNHELVTKETLLKRCEHHTADENSHPYNPNELPDLVKEISKLL
jgi:hypothetical protein